MDPYRMLNIEKICSNSNRGQANIIFQYLSLEEEFWSLAGVFLDKKIEEILMETKENIYVYKRRNDENKMYFAKERICKTLNFWKISIKVKEDFFR